MPKIRESFKKFSFSRFLKMQNTQRLPMEPLPKESLLKEPVVIEDSAKEEPTALELCAGVPTTEGLIADGILKESLLKDPLPQGLLPENFLLKVSLSKEPAPEAPLESGMTTTKIVKRKHPKATAQNNRLLRLPIELRLQIYDELLAIPRTVHMLETKKVKSHLHNIRKFDKELFTRRSRLRYKFMTPYAGYYDPRTTIFAARFSDDKDCTHRIWVTQRPVAAQSRQLPVQQVSSQENLANRVRDPDALVYGACSVATRGLNNRTWGEIHNQLCRGPEIHILELEFPKICSAIYILKFLLLGHLEGWRELRKLRVLRIRIKSGNGGPLNELEMVVLWSLADNLSQEMQRKVLLREGPKIEIGW